MNISVTKALLRWGWKEVRQGDLWPVLLAMILVVGSVFALSALAGRIEQVVVKQGKEALMADTVFTSANPIPPELTSAVSQGQLTSSLMTRFSTMMFVGEQMKLVTVKAVQDDFPLRGELRLAKGDQLSDSVKPGEVWLDPELASSLGASVGSEVVVGDLVAQVSGVIAEEPGLSFNPFRQMPTVFIHASDIGKTGAVQLGSRVEYRLFINGNDDQLAVLKQSLTLAPGDRWRDTDSSSRTTDMFNKTEQYLSLVVVIVVLMASATQFLTCHHYALSRKQSIAMLKSLGASRGWLASWLLAQISILLLMATVIGLALGIGFEFLLRIPMVDLLPDPLPSIGVTPYLTAMITCIVVSIPALGIPLLRLIHLPATAVVQSGETARFKPRWALLLLPAIVSGSMVYGDNQMVWIILTGILLLIVVLGAISVLLFKLAAKLAKRAALRLALSRINRSPVSTGLQLGTLTLSLMLLATLWLVRVDLLQDWNRLIPANAPNVFAFNIGQQDKAAYQQQIQSLGPSPMYPIARGRITQINGVEAKEYAGGEQASDALRREVNFTWGDSIPEYNQILQGTWGRTDGVSVEEEVARQLGLKIGDRLTFAINGQDFSAAVNSIRQVEWRDMKPNFYFIFTADVMADFPATWLVSYRVESAQQNQFQQLTKQFPTASVIDLRSMLGKIQELLRQVVWAVSVLAIFGLAAGALLIFTLLKLSLEERKQEITLYRILGSSRRMLQTTLWAEFGAMALVAGLLASISSDLISSMIMTMAFDIPMQWHIPLWIITPIITYILLIIVVKSLVAQMTREGYQQPQI